MKKIKYILLFLISFFSTFSFVNAGVINIPQEGTKEIQKVSIEVGADLNKGTVSETVKAVGFSGLRIFKIVLSGLFLIYIVYAGVMMLLAMGSDETKLTNSKKQLYYSLIGLVFINIPTILFSVFEKKTSIDVTSKTSMVRHTNDNIGTDNNILVNSSFSSVLKNDIVGFIEVFILFVAIFILIMEGIKVILSKGNDDVIKKAKEKIAYSLFGLLFIGLIQMWKHFAITGDISSGEDVYRSLYNLGIYFAGPIAFIFIIMAGYYYITSGGDEAKVKKAKSIIVNTLIATVLLLLSYSFLLELQGFIF